MKYLKKALITVLCILINFLCVQLVGHQFKLPLIFNAIGTCFACSFAGFAGGIVCGTLSGLFVAPLGIQSVFYCLTGAVCGVAIYFCFKKELLYRFITTIVSGYWIGVFCTIVETFINLKFNNGYTLNAWGDAFFDMLRNFNWSRLFSSFAGTFLIEIVDKQITLILFFIILEQISYFKDKDAKKSIDKVTAGILIFAMLVPLVSLHNVSAGDRTGLYSDNKGFATRIYTKADGLLSDSVNTVTQTDDGYIWIGSSKGLLRYDGAGYDNIFPDVITNVSALLSDSKGRLWIGTVDSGLFLYVDGDIKNYSVNNGLSSNAVRCLIEKEGNIYVGTSDRICKINTSGGVNIINADITYAHQMTTAGSILIGCDWNGSVFALDKDDVPIKISPVLGNVYCTCVERTSDGVMCGTNGNYIYTLDVSDKVIGIRSRIESELFNINDICEGREGRIWLCAEDALGYYDTNRKFRKRHFNDVNFTYESLFVDYQNNTWVASSKYGLMKLSESYFLYLSERGGMPSKPANAAAKYNGQYYYGMDLGLYVHDRSDNSQHVNALTEALTDIRVNDILVDKKNRLWVCTYNADGLYVFDGSEVQTISKETHGLTSNNCRNIIELSNGTIAVGTADGINLIKDLHVDKVIRKEDGLYVPQILCLCEGEDGLLYAGTDGGGISVIDNGKIVKQYTTKDGLSSNVIQRMMPYDDGMFVCTSNSLCYLKNDRAKEIKNFRYFNCIDMIRYDEGNAYILVDEGVLDVDLESLVKDDERPEIGVYGENSGLIAGISANPRNFIDGDGSLIFCTNMGVLSFGRIDRYRNYKYRYGITNVVCDGKAVSDVDGTYEIPKDTKYVSISASVRDYTLEDIRVKFYVEDKTNVYGSDSIRTVSYKSVAPISIYNPKPGRHDVHFQIYDSDENLIEETTYVLYRDMKMWEYPWFKIYFIAVFIEAIVMLTLSMILLYVYMGRRNELEMVRISLEQSVVEKTDELMKQQMRTVMALSDAIDAKDRYTSGHSARVAFYSKQIAKKLGKSEEEQNIIYRAGLLHDIGKIRVPGSIISKPGRLTEDEYTLMKLHPVTGYHILKSIGGDQMFAQGAHFHHERYDGRGYPNGLSGENIPEIARIIGVADAYDAMSSRRSYHDTFSQEYIRSEIANGKGSQFDPVIADVMLEMMDEDNIYAMKERDEKRVVLVIDDKQKRIDEIRDIMKDEAKYNILGALSGEIGLSILEATNVDLVLLDMTLSDNDGMETLAAIKANYSIPVIFMIEIEKLYEMQLASELGSDDFLTKPYVPIVLKEIVHNYTKTFDAGM